jgi:hypothetical protein
MRHLWGYLNLFPIICLILKKINIFFNIITKKVWINLYSITGNIVFLHLTLNILITLLFFFIDLVRSLKFLCVSWPLTFTRSLVIGWFSLNEAPLGLFKFISDYLPYFEKNKYIFQYFCSVHEEITSIRLYTPGNPRSQLRKGVYNLIGVISNEPNK